MKIILSIVLALLFIGCTNDTKTQETESKAVKVESVDGSTLDKAVNATQNIEIASGDEIKESLSKGLKVASEAVTAVADSITKEVEERKIENAQSTEKSALDKVVEDVKSIEVPSGEEVKASVSKGLESASNAIKSTTSEMVTVVSKSTSVNANKLYASCSACHGSNGEKKALNKSAVIQGWEAQKTIDALNGYKDGSYGGAMKALMKGQVSKLNADEINALAEYISKL